MYLTVNGSSWNLACAGKKVYWWTSAFHGDCATSTIFSLRYCKTYWTDLVCTCSLHSKFIIKPTFNSSFECAIKLVLTSMLVLTYFNIYTTMLSLYSSSPLHSYQLPRAAICVTLCRNLRTVHFFVGPCLVFYLGRKLYLFLWSSATNWKLPKSRRESVVKLKILL